MDVTSCGESSDLHRVEFVVNNTHFEHLQHDVTVDLDVYYKMNSTDGIGPDFATRNYQHYGVSNVPLVSMYNGQEMDSAVTSSCNSIDSGFGSKSVGDSVPFPPSPPTTDSPSRKASWPTPVPSESPNMDPLPDVVLHEPTSFPSFEPTTDSVFKDGEPTPFPTAIPSAESICFVFPIH